MIYYQRIIRKFNIFVIIVKKVSKNTCVLQYLCGNLRTVRKFNYRNVCIAFCTKVWYIFSADLLSPWKKSGEASKKGEK